VNDAFHAILRSLPPKRRRSKLEPFAALIHGLRRRGRSYRDVVTILRERCGVVVAVHTLHHFVRACSKKQAIPPPRRSRPVDRAPAPELATPPPSPDVSDAVWRRIAALKHREVPPASAEPKAFAYDEDAPLQLIREHKPKR
jgi:hypothetical protein